MTVSVPDKAAPAFDEIERGMKLKKCRKCGCMQDALRQAERAFASALEPEMQALLPRIGEFKTQMEPIAYDCLGCKKCWGADGTIELANNFDDVEIDSCADEPCGPAVSVEKAEWPPQPGDYLVGNREARVAVCTLSNRELPGELIDRAGDRIAITGRCDTENIGIEKVILNTVSNSHIRWLVLCGREAKGHRAGDAFLRLKERGVDANMRVLETASWRPVLKNLTLAHIARFRAQVEIVNLIGNSDAEQISEAVSGYAAKKVPPLDPFAQDNGAIATTVEKIPARAPKTLRLDKAGFFIVIPQRDRGQITCEHYENSGRLAHVITGNQAARIASTAIERGLLTQLDHAAYLGRELAKAEAAIKDGTAYEQDAALGKIARGAKDQNAQKEKP